MLGEILWSFSKDHGARPGGRAARAQAAELNEPGTGAGRRAGVHVGSGSWSAGSGVPAAGPSLWVSSHAPIEASGILPGALGVI